MTTITDDFNRADATNLGANWSGGYSGAAVQLGIASNQLYLVGSDSGRIAARWNANTFGNAQYTQIKVIALPANQNTWLPIGALQVSANAFSYYGLTYRHSSANGYTLRVVSHTATLKEITHQLSVNDVVRFEYNGVDTLTVKVNGVSVGTYTDAAPRTGNGYIGLFSSSMPAGDTWKLDDFEGGDLVASGPVLSSPTGTATGTTTATIGATTDTATGTLYGFVSTSATPPSAANLKAGTGAVWSGSVAVSSTGAKTLSATGLTAGTGYYAHLLHNDGTNDSNIVTSAQFTTTSLTKKLKLLAHADAQGDSGVAGVVLDAPTGSNITGPNKIGEFTGKTFEAALEGGKAVLKVPVADFGGSALTTSDTPVALVRNATNTTGIINCTVIEE